MNVVVFVGKVIELPIPKETNSGIKFATLTLEVERNFKNNDGIYEKDIIAFTLWRGIAEDAMIACKIGSPLAIKGRVQSRTYESEHGNTFVNYEFIAEKITFL